MGTMGVVVGGVAGKQTIEVTATEHEREVEELRAHRAYEPFGVGVGLGGAYRREDDPRTLRAEHVVERTGELRVVVADQVANAGRWFLRHEEVPGLLAGVGGVGVPGGHRDVDPTAPDLDEEQDIER